MEAISISVGSLRERETGSQLYTCAMRRFILVLVMAVSASAQTPTDVTGWGKITWHMTVADAQSVLGDGASPVAADPRDPYPTKLEVRSVSIAGAITGTVSIRTKQGSEAVCSVAIVPDIESTSPPTADLQARAMFEDLKQRLIEKYGSPKTAGERPDLLSLYGQGLETFAFWSFPSTSINLIGTTNTKSHTGRVSIVYQATEPSLL